MIENDEKPEILFQDLLSRQQVQENDFDEHFLKKTTLKTTALLGNGNESKKTGKEITGYEVGAFSEISIVHKSKDPDGIRPIYLKELRARKRTLLEPAQQFSL